MWPIALIVLLFASSAIALDSGESFRYDAVSGTYIITFKRESGEIATAVFEPANNLDPRIASTFNYESAGISYKYAIQNGPSSRQRLFGWRLDPVSNLKARRPLIRGDQEYDLNDPEVDDKFSACREAVRGPEFWMGLCSPTRDKPVPGLNISWVDVNRTVGDEQRGLAPGAKLEGFGFSSPDLPGMRRATIRGNSAGWVDDVMPDTNSESSEELDALITDMEREDFVARYAAVPTFKVPSPFGCGPLLTAIREHVADWPGQQLMESQFNAKVVTRLNNAIAGCSSKTPASNSRVVEQLGQLRIELRKQHPDLDADVLAEQGVALSAHDQRLAAKVLDFDVDFTLRKLSPVLQ